ncbi:MAG: hypothetical protein ABSH22_17030 [Tepidisphaeraceae bacterium]
MNELLANFGWLCRDCCTAKGVQAIEDIVTYVCVIADDKARQNAIFDLRSQKCVDGSNPTDALRAVAAKYRPPAYPLHPTPVNEVGFARVRAAIARANVARKKANPPMLRDIFVLKKRKPYPANLIAGIQRFLKGDLGDEGVWQFKRRLAEYDYAGIAADFLAGEYDAFLMR